MRVSLVSKTVSEIDGINTIGELLAHVARVSNPSNQMNNETAPKLLSHCLKHRHWSVFEQASFTIKIITSRAIAQQILRHRSFCFQEFSQRYSEAMEFEIYEARRQAIKNRQSSVDDMDELDKDWFKQAQKKNNRQCFLNYAMALERGVAKEQARFLLPLSTQTTLYMTGNIRSWIHYCELRCKPDTQQEHREIAIDVLAILLVLVPELEHYFATETALKDSLKLNPKDKGGKSA